MRRSKSTQALGLMVAAATLVVMVGAPAGAGIIEPELSIEGGTGIPGGTVAVTLSLADDVADVGVSAGIDLRFGAESLEFFEPVAESCTVAERISDTHGVGGRLLDVDVLNLEVFVTGAPNPPPPLGNGEIVTCEFRIKDGVPAGTVALEIESPFLGDADGAQIPVRVRNGSVRIISQPPTHTPTATSTPASTNTRTASATVTRTTGATSTATASATATVTGTSGATNTATATPTVTNTRPSGTPTATATATQTSATPHTPTATATATRTGATPTPTKKKSSGGGGCNVVPADPTAPGAAAALLLLPALLLWVRRRGE